MKKNKKVLLVGWDAADWKIINPLLDEGRLPALEKLVNGGVIGNLATLDPPLSPMLWTSIATGKKADKHGILGFIEPEPTQGGVRPVNSTSRKCKAIWNILHHHGLKCNVVGWWPTQPAEPINGVMVSNFFQKATISYKKRWDVTDGAVFPNNMTYLLKSLRIHPAELTEAHILPFIPHAEKIDQDKDQRLAVLAKIIAEAATIQSVSTYIMENSSWDFMAVYFDCIDHFGHAFMKYRAPKSDLISDEDFEIYRNVIDGAYIFHDMMLERLIKLAGEDTTVVLVSDHGFYSGHQLPARLPKIPAAPALEHRPFGIICMNGPDFLSDERVYGASLLDITPTILSLYGIPVAHDMDGKVLTTAFNNQLKVNYIDSWENVEGDFGMHPPHLQENTINAAAALQQLVELGYIDDPGEDKNKASEMAVKELKYNLSRVLSSSAKFNEAIELLEELKLTDTDDYRFILDLAKCYLRVSDINMAKENIRFLKSKENINSDYIYILEGVLLARQNKIHSALRVLKKAEERLPLLPGLLNELGQIYLNLFRYKDAQNIFEKILDIDDENASAWHGLSIAFLRQYDYENAADSALNALGLFYHFPQAHYHLGEALFYLKKYKESAEAFEISLIMNPKLIKSAQWLKKIYTIKIKDSKKNSVIDSLLMNYMKGEVIIVSGLPRSGTSMMMQILQAGGIAVLTDNIRMADNSNPKGYYEYEKVKSLVKETAWLAEAKDKAVKVIAHLLRFLPPEYNYKVIFMQRDIYEVVSSQQKMLGRSSETYPLVIAQSFEKELEKVQVWQTKEPNIDLIYVDYSKIVKDPYPVLEQINSFLNHHLDVENAAKVIDGSLYRIKTNS